MTGAGMRSCLHGLTHKMWLTDGDGGLGLTIRHLAQGRGVRQHDEAEKRGASKRAGWFGRIVHGWFAAQLSFAQVAEPQRFSRMTDSDGRFAQPPT